MTDVCKNIPQSSPDRDVNLVRSYCDVYDELSAQAQTLRGSERLSKLDEMAKVLNKIQDLQNNRTPVVQGNVIRSPYEMNNIAPAVIQINPFTNALYNSPIPDKFGKMQDYESKGISYAYADARGMSERFEKLSGISEITENDSYNARQFNGIFREGETKKVQLRFGGNTDEFMVSYQQGIITFKATRAPFRGEGSTLVNMSSMRHSKGIQKIVIGPGLNEKGFGYRAVLFFQISGQ